MAPRVTALTSLAAVRQLGADLAKSLADAGTLASAPHLGRQLDDLQSALADPTLLMEVWTDDGTTAGEATRWLLGEPAIKRVTLAFATSARPLVTSPGQLAAPILVWLRGEEAETDPAAFDERALVISTRRSESRREDLIVDRAAPPGVLSRLFVPPSFTQVPDLLIAAAGARTLETLAAIAGLALDQESRAVRAKRALAQQRAAAGQGRQPSSAPNEVMTTLRSRLQRSFAELTRGIDERFALAFGGATSTFWTEMDARLDAISTVDQEARVKTVATRLSPDTEEEWLLACRTSLRRHCVADLSALRDTQRAAVDDIETVVADAGGPPLVLQFQPMSDERLDRLLDAHVLLQRKYQGEIARRGMFEYLMMARRYQTVVFMLLSAFGLSFLRTYREFMIPAAVLLMSFGGLQVAHSVQRERAEVLAKELEKVRELLRMEAKRIVGDVQRAWIMAVSQHVADQVPLVLGQVEAALRDYFNRLTAEGSEERQRLQRQLQAFDAAERKLAAPGKARQAVAQAVAQVRGELRQLIATAVQGAVA